MAPVTPVVLAGVVLSGATYDGPGPDDCVAVELVVGELPRTVDGPVDLVELLVDARDGAARCTGLLLGDADHRYLVAAEAEGQVARATLEALEARHADALRLEQLRRRRATADAVIWSGGLSLVVGLVAGVVVGARAAR